MKNVEMSNDYRRRLSEPNNEEKLEKLRQEIIWQLYQTGYTVTLQKVNTMLNEWLKWQRKRRKYQYRPVDMHDIRIPHIFRMLSQCDSEFLSLIHTLTICHLELKRGENLDSDSAFLISFNQYKHERGNENE